jgi:hypothetical protein
MLSTASPGADVAPCDAIYSESRRRCGALRCYLQRVPAQMWRPAMLSAASPGADVAPCDAIYSESRPAGAYRPQRQTRRRCPTACPTA